MQIIHYPHPVLSHKSSEVRRIDDNLRATVAHMLDLMYEARGVGLAANQVGLPLRFFVANFAGDKSEKDEEFVFINPVIVNRRGSVVGEEGCLSLPQVYADVRRAEEIVVEAYDLSGQGFRMELDDLPARIIQHENDHLDGTMFIERLTESSRRAIDPKVQDFVVTWDHAQSRGEIPGDEELRKQLKAIAVSGVVPPLG